MIGETVKGYEIKQAVCFDNDRGFALAENPRAVQPFVTWQFTDDSGAKDFYWGHYFSKRESSLADFEKRVMDYKENYPTLAEKYNYLAAAEMSGEQNYNQIDGLVNNLAQPKADLTDGVTHEELMELAPETLAKSEKPSILEQLRDFKPKPSEPSGKSDKAANIER